MNQIQFEILVSVIEKIEARFPSFACYNGLIDEKAQKNLGKDSYSVVVYNVTEDEMINFLEFIETEIYLPLAESGNELPMIIPLQTKEIITPSSWAECAETEEFYSFEHFYFSAEDYGYSIAA